MGIQSLVKVEVDKHAFDAAYNLTDASIWHQEVHRAYKSAADRTGKTIRSDAWKMVKTRYAINRSAFYQDVHIRSSEGYVQNQSYNYELEFRGYGIPLVKYGVLPNTRQALLQVKILQQDGYKTLKHAYVADLGKFGKGVFQRTSTKRNSSQQLFGVSAIQMLDHPAVRERIQETAAVTFNKRFEHEIDWRMKKYYQGEKG